VKCSAIYVVRASVGFHLAVAPPNSRSGAAELVPTSRHRDWSTLAPRPRLIGAT
jgi:hypothetical protein